MEFWIVVEDGKITRASSTTDGCWHSMVSGSAAAVLAEGMTLEKAAAISQADMLETIPGLPEESVHCALLASDTLKAAVADYRSRRSA